MNEFNEHVDLHVRLSYERSGVMVVTKPLVAKIRGFVVTHAGRRVIAVNSKLPRAERSATVGELLGIEGNRFLSS